ncbi:cation:dicarboxylase symporter family transporter [uncultured Algimonas sp.]|uniref:dicarboxylate/amino acid:cation symporter n=1 Tax=uncultured Algimonas sp. TaxID=1547920 RepID=UPI002635D660|nr:cation:dicarboxylase symporter family transporter [uncultured Algimonas sp.]
MKTIHDIPLLLLVIVSAAAAFGFWGLGAADELAAPIVIGDTFLSKSVAGLAKDALFVPLRPLMYALIILSIGSSIAISTGGLGAKFVRVLVFFLMFSLIGMAIAIAAYFLFAGETILPDPSIVGDSGADIASSPFAEKIYGVLTSALMICIYTGLIFGAALKRLGLGREADAISDMFIAGFRKFLQYTIPLAVFGSITLALARPNGWESLVDLANLLKPYMLAMVLTWLVILIVTSTIQGRGPGFILRAVLPQAVVAFSTSSSIATLVATKKACNDMGANGDEATPFFTIGATINMVGTLIGLLLMSLYAMSAFGIEVDLGDALVVGFQSLVFATAAAGTPSASVVLLQDILVSQGVSGEYATYVTALIITIDTLILDRLRTVLNTQSDSMSTANGLKLYYRKPRVLVDDVAE